MQLRSVGFPQFSVKQQLKSIRDHPFFLSLLVAGLKFLRSTGFFRGENLYQHVPYRGLVKVELPSGRCFQIIARGGQIENRLYWDGVLGHEPVSMEAWIKYASRAKTVLDIGANSGVFSLAASAAGAKEVHAFEPIARICAILRMNIEVSQLDNVTAWHCAVGQSDTFAEIQDPGGDAPTSASLSIEFSKNHLSTTTPTRIQVVAVDSWAEINGIHAIDLIKLDVEGYEEFALRGMAEIIRRDRPVVLIEVLNEFEERIRTEVNQVFGFGYSWNRIDEGSGTHSRNVLLVPEDAAR